MLKMLARGADGRKVVILGLSRKNTELLLEGRPIAVDTRELGVADGPVVFIYGGETESAMEAELRSAGFTIHL